MTHTVRIFIAISFGTHQFQLFNVLCTEYIGHCKTQVYLSRYLTTLEKHKYLFEKC